MLNSDHIRSFVLRQGKMTPAQRDALHRLKDIYCLPSEGGRKIDVSEIFPGKTGFVMEIGFGMGFATAEIAEADPETGYLGVEVHTPGVGKLLWEIETRNLDNIRIIQEDAVVVLKTMIEDETLDGIHIFFPDPWQKKKHHKRRLVNPEFLRLAFRKLKTGAYIYLATDWEDYAERILSVLSWDDGFVNEYKDYADPIGWRPPTAFESKGRKADRPIREIFFRKKS